jgi:hypothetical protein
MKKVTLLLKVSFMAFIVLGMMSSASAITITPTTQLQMGEDFDLSGFDLLYKAEVGNELNPATTEEGPFADNYGTTFSNSALDPENALITYDPGELFISGSPLYLYVKDGEKERP